MSFSFGSPGFTFGRPQQPQQQQSTPAFSNISFGSPQTFMSTGFGGTGSQPTTQEAPSSGGFNFGATPNPSTQSTGFAFGLQTPAVSNAPVASTQSTGFSFGMTAPASALPVLGPNTGFNFGVQPQQQTSAIAIPAVSATTNLLGTGGGGFAFGNTSTIAPVAPQPQQQQSTGFTFGAPQASTPATSLATTGTNLWGSSVTQATGFGSLTQPTPAISQPASSTFGFGLGSTPSFESSFTTPTSGTAPTSLVSTPSTVPSITFPTATPQSGFTAGTTSSGFTGGITQSGFTTGTTPQSGFTTGTAPSGLTTLGFPSASPVGSFGTASSLGGFGSGVPQTQTGPLTSTQQAFTGAPSTTSIVSPFPQSGLQTTGLSTTSQATGFSFGNNAARTQSSINTSSGLVPSINTQSASFGTTGTPAKVAASTTTTTGAVTNVPTPTPVPSLGAASAPAPVTTLADTQVHLTTATTTTASSSVPTPAITFRQLEEDINKWTVELDEQEKIFLTQATQVNTWDSLLTSNGEKITELNETLQKVKLDQGSLEQEIDFIRGQQRELEEILVPLERHLQSIPNIAVQQHADLEREHTYELVENVDAQLRRMAQDLKEVIDQLNANTRSQDANSQINQIGKILNAHMDTLQWIDQHTGVLQKKVEDVAKLQERQQADHERLQHLGRN